MAAPRVIDWERVEPGWREGIKSVQVLADEYEADTGRRISKSAINKHFKELGVPRDLSAKIRAKADSIVSASIVSGMVSVETTDTDAKIINGGAVAMATVQLSHRRDIAKLRDRAVEYEQELGECGGDLAKRANILKSLAETQCRLIAAEREAYGMDKDRIQPDTGLSGESIATLRRLKAQIEAGA